jgi:predicted DNA-binding transcriptional regulator YafY
MKLYNLFNEIIFEEINRKTNLLTEGVSESDIIAAIDGKYNVNIEYRDIGESAPSRRYIQVYNLAQTKGGNDAIRAYQINGGSKTDKNGWKIFRIDRIVGWYPTNMKWSNPVSDFDNTIPSYNQMGDNSMSSIKHKVDTSTFGRQRSDISQNPNINNNDELNK